MPQIVLGNAWYRYPGGKDWAIRGASLSLGAGEIVVVTGPNGGGKTTLLKLLGLLYRPQRGRVIVGGRDYWSLPRRERVAVRRKIVYVHEKPVMLRGSVLYNVAYGLTLRGLDQKTATKKALKALRLLGAEHLAAKQAKTLSSGEAQLVSIARAIALDPETLLLDEPLAHLDRAKRRKLVQVLSTLASTGKTLVIATHNEALPNQLHGQTMTRTIYVENGHIAEEE